MDQAKAAAEAQVVILERRAEERIREIVREEIAEARKRYTLPAPPPGCVGADSHSGAAVVPRGSSRPPGHLAECELDPSGGLRAISDSIVDMPGACTRCRMLACVCHLIQRDAYPFDDTEGGLEK